MGQVIDEVKAASEGTQGGRCILRSAIAELAEVDETKDDAEDFRALIWDPQYIDRSSTSRTYASKVELAFRRRGKPVSQSLVSRHRRNQCATCMPDRAEWLDKNGIEP